VNEYLLLPDLLRRAAAIQRDGRRVLACVVVNARGSTPQSAGAMMLVDDAANSFGTVGGGCIEAELRRRAFELLERKRTGVLEFDLDHDYGWDDGVICGGTLRVVVSELPDPDRLDAIGAAIRDGRETSLPFIADTETDRARYVLTLPPRPRLYIAGAGHIGVAVARHGLRLDFDVSLFDDRADLLERHAPDGCRSVAGEIAETLRAAPIDDATYCLIVTRGHRHDARALEAVVGRGARYTGMIGSRRKVGLIREELVNRGIASSALDVVHAPVGLDIGAITVEEIALSIAGQLVEARRQEDRPAIGGPMPVTERAEP
jgi:xanthine dehydrogenase accessory factor